MSWKKVEIGVTTGDGVVNQTYEECPLEKFQVTGGSAGPGFYDKYPVEACLGCNFADLSKEVQKEACQCPSDLTWEGYDKLRKEYADSGEELSRTGFWKYVEEKWEAAKAS